MSESVISPCFRTKHKTCNKEAFETSPSEDSIGAPVEMLHKILASHSIETDHLYLTVTGAKNFNTDEEDLRAVSAELLVEKTPVVSLTVPDETSPTVSYDIGLLEMLRIKNYKHRSVIIYKHRTTSRIVRALHPEPSNCTVVSPKKTVAFWRTKICLQVDEGCIECRSCAALFVCHRSSDPIRGKKCERCWLNRLRCSLSLADGFEKEDKYSIQVKEEPITDIMPAAMKTRGSGKSNSSSIFSETKLTNESKRKRERLVSFMHLKSEDEITGRSKRYARIITTG
jgi:hypothetical protein